MKLVEGLSERLRSHQRGLVTHQNRIRAHPTRPSPICQTLVQSCSGVASGTEPGSPAVVPVVAGTPVDGFCATGGRFVRTRADRSGARNIAALTGKLMANSSTSHLCSYVPDPFVPCLGYQMPSSWAKFVQFQSGCTFCETTIATGRFVAGVGGEFAIVA